MDITKLSAFEMKKRLYEKEISSRELVESHFNKIDEVDKDINAFITLNKEEALKAADRVDEKIRNKERIGLLAGIPIGIKDNILTKGLRTTCSSKMLENFVPEYNAEVIDRIRNADGIIMGKTNMDEFAMGSTTETSYFGPTKNPINMERIPGGSSGGSAAAVSSNEVALALGTDTGGSVRQPASHCGVVGILPSYGIVSRYGTVAMANTMDQVGVFGRDVADAVLMLSSITGYDKKDSTSFNNPEGTIIFQSFGKEIDYNNYLKGMKVGLPKEFFNSNIDENIKSEILKSIKIFETLGADIEEISLPHLEYALSTYQILSTAEISSNLARFDGVRYGHRAKEYKTLDELYANTRTEAFGEEVKRRILFGTYYLSNKNREEYYIKALKLRRLIKGDFNKAFDKYDIILSPTSPILPSKLGQKSKDRLENYNADLFTTPVNLAGLCAMSVPCGNVEGLPVGIQIIGDRFKEANMIKAGIGLEGGIKMRYKTIIGLEIHTELMTNTKMFCSCTNAFGGEANTHCCEVCLGLPGAMPLINKQAIEFAIKAGLAFNSNINAKTRMDRKNYFYADLVKGYQISQDDIPLCEGGYVEIDLGDISKKVNLERIHIEEDTGKLTHTVEGDTLIDYNRAGVPLIEIVTKPDMNTAEEARLFLENLRARLKYIEVSDCKMEEGSLRCDVNINIVDTETGAKTNISEIKNLNSFRAAVRAIEYEEKRHISLLEEGKNTLKETRRWDEVKAETITMRTKGESDYRFDSDGDIAPIELSDTWIEEIRNSLPELPHDKKERFIKQYDLSEYDAGVLTGSKGLALFFEETIKHLNDSKLVSNWIMGDVMRRLNDEEIEIEDTSLTPKMLGELITIVKDGKINNNTGKKVLKEIFETGKDPETIVKEKGLIQISDEGELETIINTILDDNEQSIIDFKNGKDRALGFLVGQVMKASRGKANPQVVNKMVAEMLNKDRL